MRYHKGAVLLDLGSERGPNFGTKNNPRFYADKLLILVEDENCRERYLVNEIKP